MGGIHPGMNVGSSPSDPQVSVHILHLQPSQAFLDLLEERLLLIYTGIPRLAKNLLQNVVRNWYSKEPDIISCFEVRHLDLYINV